MARATVLALSLLPALALGRIDYRVIPDPVNKAIRVEMTVPVKDGTTELRMPSWAPGAYILTKSYNAVKNLTARDELGTPLDVLRPRDDTWRVFGGKSVTVSYTLPLSESGGTMHWSGPSTYLYVVDRKTEDVTLRVDRPEGWDIAVGLEGKPGEYVAPDYDTLADNPVTIGNFVRVDYVAGGRPHTLAMVGVARNEIDKDVIRKACEFVSTSQAEFFGGLPFRRYVWHFTVTPGKDGAGGLEHLSSTEMSIAKGVGPGVRSVLAHEFFHLWNVKRIRSRPLGPFDYGRLPETGALWWLEGVTDYYADMIPRRWGGTDDKELAKSIASNLRSVRANPALAEVSPYDSSYRVGDANEGRGNSNGYKISYYNLGWLIGLVLDAELLERTNGRRSLDDVTKALYAITGNGRPGFAEPEIRRQLVRFGGEEMGPFYDRVVMRPNPIPVEAALAKFGWTVTPTTEDGPPTTGVVLRRSESGRSVVATDSPAGTGLVAGDEIVDVNGQPDVTPLRRPEGESPLKVRVKRGAETLVVEVPVKKTPRTSFTIAPNPEATDAQKRLASIWLSKRKK